MKGKKIQEKEKSNLQLKNKEIQKLKEQGITLIALVVTIIILLILAGVTLNLALGEGGIFARAKNTVDRYQAAQANELGQLAQLEEMLNSYGQGGSTGGEETQNTTTTPVTPPTPSGGTGSSEVADDLKEYQGKYVDIGLDVTGNTDTTDDWKLFYATKDRIFLIAADYVQADKLTTWGVIGNGRTLENYGFKNNDTYCVNWIRPTTFLEEDLADLALVKHETYDLKSNRSKNNSIAVSHLLNTTAWNGIKEAADKKTSIDFVIGGPTLEMWCAAWNRAVENDDTFKQIQANRTNASGYYVGCGATSTTEQNYLFMNGTTSALESNLTTLGEKYVTFFPHITLEHGSHGYWLASPSSNGFDYLMTVYFLGEIMYTRLNDVYSCVRPVVCLKSGVRLVERANAQNIYDVTEL